MTDMTVGTNSAPGVAAAAEERFRDAPEPPAAAADGLCGVPPQAVDSARARGAGPAARPGRAARAAAGAPGAGVGPGVAGGPG
ncbi:hypothetical protein AB0428_29940, partial [Streptomyces virginiae]